MVEFIVFHANGDIGHYAFRTKAFQDAFRKMIPAECSWAEVPHE